MKMKMTTSTTRALIALPAVVALALGGSSCQVLGGTDGPPTAGDQPSQTGPAVDAHLVDFTGSALAEGQSDLNSAARNAIREQLLAAEAGSTVRIVGFTNRPGQACDPIVLNFAPQPNLESDKQLRSDIADALPGLWSAYRDCLRDPGTGLDGAGSGVFGATALAATIPGLRSLTVWTDACTVRELAPQPETCDRRVLNDPSGPETLVAGMPPALKLAIAVPVTFALVGRGTQLKSTQLLALNRVLQLWGQASGTTVTVTN